MSNPLTVLLDQNVPRPVTAWLQGLKSSWKVHHAIEVGLAGKDDHKVFEWAQIHQAVIITFDEDFGDQRSFPIGQHHGIIRLRIWPTTIEETQRALERLLAKVSDDELLGSLVIIDRTRIRVRSRKSSTP